MNILIVIFDYTLVISTAGRNLAALDLPVVPSLNGVAISEAYKNKNNELKDHFQHDSKTSCN